jgi:predicted ArsR family transcriptional regulator
MAKLGPNTPAAIAQRIADRTSDAYSVDRYKSWALVAEKLLRRGYREREVEAILRSKWTRWAADGHSAPHGKVPASAMIDYLNREVKRIGVDALQAQVDALVAGTL